MNYRKLYKKLIRLGKVMTPEGSLARNKAKAVKIKYLPDRDLRRKDLQGKLLLDCIIRDTEFYNYHYIPLENERMPNIQKLHLRGSLPKIRQVPVVAA